MYLLEEIRSLTEDTFAIIETEGVFGCTVEIAIVLVVAIGLMGFIFGKLMKE